MSTMDPGHDPRLDVAAQLSRQVIEPLKAEFIGKDESST